jgi:hypothetical protein
MNGNLIYGSRLARWALGMFFCPELLKKRILTGGHGGNGGWAIIIRNLWVSDIRKKMKAADPPVGDPLVQTGENPLTPEIRVAESL